MKSKKTLAGLLGVGISAAILVYLAQKIQWELFLAEFHRVNLWYLPFLIFILMLSFLLRAIRWEYLFPSDKKLTLSSRFDAILLGFFASTILPLRAGELVRPIFLSRWQPVSFSLGFATVVTERVFDVLAIMLLLGVSLVRIEEAPPLVTGAALGLLFVAGAIVLVMILSYSFSETMLRFANAVLGYLLLTLIRGDERKELRTKLSSGIMSMIEEFLKGLKSISSLKQLGLAALWSLALWFCYAWMYQVGMWAFGESASFWTGILITVIIALAVALPSAQAFVGTFQWGCVIALHNLGSYSEEYALAYSVLVHFFQIVVIVVVGSYVLQKRGLAF